MIITRLVGGLGNQMFQYAAGLRLARANDLPLKLDVTAFADYWRPFGLRDWMVDEPDATTDEISALRGPTPGRLRRLVERALALRSSHRSCHREGAMLRFDARVLSIRGPAYIDGFWQDERYFLDIAAEVRERFRPRLPMPSEAMKVLAEIECGTSVSMHFRRGDYVSTARRRRIHEVCGPEYYRAAISRMRERVPHATFFIFSDDIPWCRRLDLVDSTMRFVELGREVPPSTEMALMSRCSHHVIANSTFSWWGAWLNPDPERIVVAPRRWSRSWRWLFSRVVPSRWIRI